MSSPDLPFSPVSSAPLALASTVKRMRVSLEREGHTGPLARTRVLRWILERQIAAMDLDEDVAAELPGFFESASSPLLPPSTLESPELAPGWHDVTTLGWAYQFWNDLDREAIDHAIGPRGRVRLDQIASKTQLFTERYMVDWLVQNSVGRLLDLPTEPRYRVRCEPDPRARAWQDLRILDPACGTGHFLVGAFDFLFEAARAREEASSRSFDPMATAHHIVGRVLHGIDLDPHAVRVAAAALWLSVKRVAPKQPLPPLRLAAAAIDDAGSSSTSAHAVLEELRWRGTLTKLEKAPAEVLERLRSHTTADDLGVRTEPAAATVGRRLVELLRDRAYDVVLSNPPYLATAKITLEPERVAAAFDGMPDLFAAFTQRSLELCREDGLVAFVALSNWMFLSSFRPVRELLLRGHVLLLADLGKGAFRHASKLIQTAMVVAQPRPSSAVSRGVRVGSRDDIAADQTDQIAAALGEPERFLPFDARVFTHVEGAPFLFWIDVAFLQRYASLPKIEDVARGAGGIATGDNERFVRSVWEVSPRQARAALAGSSESHVPYLKGAEGREWIEPCRSLLRAPSELRASRPGQKVEVAAELGVAYTTIGQRFGARMHTTHSVRDVSGASFFPRDCTLAELLCALNKRPVRELACALNPTINFQLGDVRRLPFDREPYAARIVEVLRREYDRSERGNELSPLYEGPWEPSAWAEAQRWAQAQVDRPLGAPLAAFTATPRAASAHDRLSHAVGVAFGRFGPGTEGWLDEPPAESVRFFVADAAGLGAPCFRSLHEVWSSLKVPFEGYESASDWLRLGFFATHRRRYDNRPPWLALSSRKRSFVVWVSLHRWHAGILHEICDEHLVPRRKTAARRDIEELDELVAITRELADRGPPPTDAGIGAGVREVDAPFEVDLEDGIPVHCAALWPLLEPQWKDPRRVWRALATPTGKRHADWSRLVKRYFPSRARANRRIVGA